VFSLELPLGQALREGLDAAPASPSLPLKLTLQGRLIVVVEDEAAVREGLVVLMQGWGARVLSFDDVESLQAWCDGPAVQVPDLQLVDYHLPGGRNGFEALALLRARWPERRLPAVVVTAASLGGLEDEAQQHDCHLLIKPVPPNKLRALIAFELGVRQ
jgi:CheY-like chemotaxis protein